MVRKTSLRSVSAPRLASLRATVSIALVTTALVALGCGDEGVTTDYPYEGAAGAAGGVYRPLRPNVNPGAAGTYGIDRTPGLNTGGSASYSPGSAGSTGVAGTFGRGSAGTSGSDLDFGSAGTSGSSGF